ncbi:MAG: hypothetical protein H7839_16955 [Magnetococcus sp. YQC-5]
MLTPSSEASQKRAAEMRQIADSKEMKDLLNISLPNTGEKFAEISRKGLASIRRDTDILKVKLK